VKQFLRKTLTGWAPADEASRDAWSHYKLGDVYRADVVKPRSYQHHKLCMALLSLTYGNQDRYTSFEHFRKAVAIEAGHVDELIGLDGVIYLQPKSISYSALDEVEFTKVFGAMMTVCARLLGGIGMTELEGEVSRYADDKYGRAA
jgi:hypothetical protein